MPHDSSRIFLPLLLAAWLAPGEQGLFCQSAASPAEKVKGRESPRQGVLHLRAGERTAEFFPEGARLYSGGHLLTVEFLGTAGVMPTLLAEPRVVRGTGSPLRRALYDDLWPGIKLIYCLNPRGGFEARYVLAPGAEVSRIRIRYSVPLSLQEDGTLRFQFSTGTVNESSPEAWQEIKGERIPVKAAFTIAGSEVGFRVGNYDWHYPLIIDPNIYAKE